MKKTLLTLLVMLLSLCVADAKVLTPEESLAKAIGMMQNGSHKAKAKALLAKRAVLLKTEKSADDTPLCYVFNTSDGGYIITGADDRAASILGYVDDCTYEESMQIPAFREWMENCKDAMTWLSRQPEVTTTTTKNATASAGLEETVEPLLGNIAWGQGSIFNDMCPTDSTNQHAMTGCVATAMAQIMRYWKWPEQGVNEHYNQYYPAQYVNFKESHYAWDKMLENYTGTDIPEENKTAVAKLMYDVGCSLDMRYGTQQSGTGEYNSFKALPTYYKYSAAIRHYQREFFTADGWNELLKTELSAKRPFMMQAYTGVGGGHAFVVDGYNQDGLYHVNWGWNGKSNSYFSLNYMDPDYQGEGGSTGGYYVGQSVTMNIMPDTISAEFQPYVHVVGTMRYNKSTGKVTIIITNDAAFTTPGAAMAVVTKADGTIVGAGEKYDLNNLYATKTADIGFIVSNEFAQEGYQIIPYYQLEGSGETKIIPSALSLDDRLVYKNNEWQYENSPYPEIVSVDTIQAYKYCVPKFNVTFKCPESRTTELNTVALASICKDDTICCYGLAQLHMKPGETQTVEFPCAYEWGKKIYNLKESRYQIQYAVLYNSVSDDKTVFREDSVTLNDAKLSVLDSLLTFDKEVYAAGDTITATTTLVNGGGPIEVTVYLMMADSNNKPFIRSQVVSIPQNSSTTVTFKLLAPAAQKYGGIITYNLVETMTKIVPFTVVDNPTGISDVKVSDDINGDVIKCIENGRLVIKKNGKTYSPDGARIK